jgi:hypothetical protein
LAGLCGLAIPASSCGALHRDGINPGGVALVALEKEALDAPRSAEAGRQAGLLRIANEFAGALLVQERDGRGVLQELRHGRGFLS